jgi:hypothetical protein
MLAKIDARHERMMVRMDSQLESCLEKTEAMDLEANPEEIESEAKHEEIPKEEVTVETFGVQKEWCGAWHLALPTAEETDQGQWWVREEVGCHPQRDATPSHSCTAEGTRSSRTRQG